MKPLSLLLFISAFSYSIDTFCNEVSKTQIKYKGYIEIGLSRNIKDLNWNTTEISDNQMDIKHCSDIANSLLSFKSFINAKTVNGVFINNKYFTGISLGVEQFKGECFQTPINFFFIPIGVDAKIYFSKGQFRPFVSICAGRNLLSTAKKTEYFPDYSIDKIKSDNFIQPLIGFQILGSRTKNRIFTFNIGCKFQKVRTRFIHPNNDWFLAKSNLNLLTINFGYSF